MKMQFTLLPFSLPNFLRIKELPGDGGLVDVATLSDKEAKEYWQTVEVEWMNHVKRRRSSVNGDAGHV